MTVLLPRLDREQTQAQIDTARSLSIGELAARMPVRDVVTTASPLGGLEIAEDDLFALRAAIVEIATEHGYPDSEDRLSVFDGRCARTIHRALSISPHEAGSEAAWSNLTVCWLMDVAVWRWSGMRDDRRFRGDVNRNTFRRLWGRAEVFGPDIDLTQLGEDELVNIMERPTIASNRPLARALASSFLDRVHDGDESGRMMLMRDAGKRLVRLTPIVDFHALDRAELQDIIRTVLEASSAGGPLPQPTPHDDATAPVVSDGVEQLPDTPRLDQTPEETGSDEELPVEVSELYEIALAIARRTGRVTNVMLREVIPIEPDDARRVLQDLVARGELRRRGQTKGTHYVLPSEEVSAEKEAAVTRPTSTPDRPSVPSTLRRYLRRRH
jgi:hypothetical protein